MIKKERQVPPKIPKLAALLRRLPPSHPKRPLIESDLVKYKIGHQGEQSLDYYLSFLPKKTYHIFHGLRLSDNPDYFFQLDTVLLSPFFILILEVKNIAGTIFFDGLFNQLIRTHEGKEEGFKDPLLQVQHQKSQLESWLRTHKFPPIPIETLVVISNSATVIKATQGNSKRLERVTHSFNLLPKIERFENSHKIEKLSEKELNKLSRTFLKKHIPGDPDVLSRFSILKEELLKGVHCPECFSLPMVRARGSWVCQSCGHSSKSAHIEALRDYALLISPKITNQQLRDFLQLPSRSTASKLLTAMDLEHSGETKGRKYRLPVDE